ncbi:MAG TPA: YkgJ family cysteine cluster protein [Vicinamibacteria bacterium]|nr:YkgJ family cysteine cluster protein [Vicinamibacteria bacterium]
MVALHHYAEQRFTCAQCGRCCRRGWDIALTAGEVEGYRKAGAAAWYTETDTGTETETGTVDPFEPLSGHAGHFRIRKRADGACGFLSAENRCRIHEQLGGARKPLTCRLFPFRFHPVEGKAVVSASFCCPTVVASEGEPVTAQIRALGGLYNEWARTYPEPKRSFELVTGRAVSGATLATLRDVLRTMLDHADAEGRLDLRANVRRIAGFVDDLTRHRVVKLAPERFAEYLELTGRYAAASDRPSAERGASTVGRVLSRGFLFAVLAAREQLRSPASGLRLRLRARLVRLLAHTHGVGPAVGDVDLRAGRLVSRGLEDPAVHGLVHHYLRATVEDLGTGRRPVLDELAMAFALLNAALAFAAMRAGQAGRTGIDAAALTEGLLETMDLAHAEPEGAYARVLGSLAGGLDALWMFGESTEKIDRHG